MAQEILFILGQIDPIWFPITMLLGFVLGFASKEIEFEWKTLFLMFYFYVPFVAVRLFAFILGGSPVILMGAGVITAIFIIIYALAFYIGRKSGRIFGK